MNPDWSSLGYLMDSRGLFQGLFHSMAANAGVLNILDFLNIWGLILIGAGLITGLFTKASTLAGMLLLLFYYLSHPAIIGADYAIPSEGSYLWINKNLIEMLALGVLFMFPTGCSVVLDRLVFKSKQ